MPALRTRDTHSRALEVSTDKPQPPALHIVSPTPRAFTFPISHNLSDSPYSSPSNSPFEPDHLRSFPATQQCTLESTPSTSTPPPPQSLSQLTRAQSPIHPDSSPVSLKRRKSTSSGSVDPAERRPKKGDEDYVKRPENAFILFRRQCCEDRQQILDAAASGDIPAAKKQRQADLSKTISQQWKGLSSAERKVWEDKAALKKREHEQLHPGYVYRPQRAKDKDGRARNKKASLTPLGPGARKLEYCDEGAEPLTFTIPMLRAPGPQGRSASAPTPPPYQTIQVPNVYGLNASCPTSPSLLPMISRRSAYPGFQPLQRKDSAMGFDFVPNPSYVAPASFAMPGQFESNLQSSEFLRSMWNTQPTHHSPLRQLSLPHTNDMLLPAHQIISPSTSMNSTGSGSGSGSSGPSSPANGPFTPVSAYNPSHNAHLHLPSQQQHQQQQAHHQQQQQSQFAHLTLSSPDPHSSFAEAELEIERQMEMERQLQQEFAHFTWGGAWGNNGAGACEPAVLTDSDFDINCIPPLELGGQKYTESMALPGAGLEYGGGDFGHGAYHDDSHGLMAFDEMMTGQSF